MEMTMEKFLGILDKGVEEAQKYKDDPAFIKLTQAYWEEREKEEARIKNEFQKKETDVKLAIKKLIDINKNVVPNIKTLKISGPNDYDFYLDSCVEQEYESESGNVVVCTYNISDSLSSSENNLSVLGMYKDVDIHNFENEKVFVVKGKKASVVGDYGADNLETFLEYIGEDIAFYNTKVDKNLFNLNVDYYIMSDI